MKVAVVVEWADPWRGGAETSTLQFVRRLVDRGIEVDIVTRSRLSPAPRMGVHTLTVRGPSRALASAAFVRAADKSVGRRYHIVHAVTPCLRADVYEPRGGTVAETIERNVAIRIGTVARAIKRLSARLNYRQRLMLDLERRLLNRPRRPYVIALSTYVVRQLKEHYDYPVAYIRRIFNGVEPDAADATQRRADRAAIRHLYGIAEDDLLVLLVAHNFRLKGVGCWIDALRLVRDDPGAPIRSLVVGKDDPVHWQRRAQRRGVADRIRFCGPTQRIAAFYHAADVLVHPTYYDPCSRVVLEALASGLPAVTTAFDGSAEAVTDGVNGFVLPNPTAIADLAECVRSLRDANRRADFSAAAQAIAPDFSMERHCAGVVALYEAMLDRRGPA